MLPTVQMRSRAGYESSARAADVGGTPRVAGILQRCLAQIPWTWRVQIEKRHTAAAIVHQRAL